MTATVNQGGFEWNRCGRIDWIKRDSHGRKSNLYTAERVGRTMSQATKIVVGTVGIATVLTLLIVASVALS